MADDPALIWEKGADRKPRPPRSVPRRTVPRPRVEEPIPGGRIPLAEAHHQFGVAASTLASWARSGRVDAVKENGRWMVTPASVAARLSLRHGGRPRRRAPTSEGKHASGPTADGTAMLVPRDAWDKLMDQLGNLHEAGQMLAEARERAARAETESTFLRERLAELRDERDRLRREAAGSSPDTEGEPPSRPGWFHRVRRSFRRRQPG